MSFAKSDLHLHLDGSLPVETILTLAREQGIALPAYTVEALRPHCTVSPDCRSLADYLTRFALPVSVLQTADALYSATRALLAQLADEGLTYTELRFAPLQHGQRGLPQAGAIDAVLHGVRDSRMPRAGVILCMLTTADMGANDATATLAARYRGQGVCGLDLAGQECARPLSDFARIFAQAVENDVQITIHAGEACGADSVAAALDLGARRIGHGTRAIEDPAVVRRVVETGVTLEQCVTSNVQTHCVSSLAEHPIRRLFDAGVHIAICTDNRTVSGTTLAHEYDILQRDLGFTDAECAVLARYAREAAFLPQK